MFNDECGDGFIFNGVRIIQRISIFNGFPAPYSTLVPFPVSYDDNRKTSPIPVIPEFVFSYGKARDFAINTMANGMRVVFVRIQQ